MNKIYPVLFALILFFAVNSRSVSQPKLTFDFNFGYSQPVGDFKNGISLLDTVPTSWPYLMRDGYNIGVTGKMTLKKVPNVKVVLGLNYNGFKNWGDLQVTTNEGNGVTTTNVVEFIPKVAILALSLGGEYSFKPKENINPFVGLDFTTNFYSGSFQSNPSSNFQRSQLKAETRFGFQLGGGVDFVFSKYIGMVLGLKYNLANLIGKGDYQEDVTSYQVGLNDNSYPGQDSRNISYFQLYTGVSFYFGQY